MKKEKLLLGLTILPIMLGILAMLFLPTEVPVHYGMSLQVIQYGSKYLLLAIGVITLLLGAFLNFIYRAYKNADAEKLVYCLGIFVLVVFNVINLLGLAGAFILS